MQTPLPRMVVLACALVVGCLLDARVWAATSAAAVRDVVMVTEGQLLGTPGADASLTVFKGIPFAAPPVGVLRWQPPQPALPWTGVRKADTFGSSAMQEDRRSFGPWTEEYMFDNAMSEDCLTLNIWTPAKTADERRAVFVYIHGGAYYGGSGEIKVYDGEGLAKKGVVVVTINYRLGVFGFLAHPELTAESPHHASGNYGLMDQIAALRWVKRNIAAFGGDPERVTIGGQSAGAGSVHHLLVSPEARGLFHRAIAQSGPWRRTSRSPTLTQAEAEGQKFARAIGARSLRELRALPAAELLAQYLKNSTPTRPIVDGWIVPDQVTAVQERGEQIDVPLLTGWTADEGSFMSGYGVATVADVTAQAERQFGTRAAEALALYPMANDADAGEVAKQFQRDHARADLLWWTQLRAKTGQSSDWGYSFDRAIPWPQHPEYQAFHSGDLPYTFNNLRQLDRPWEDADRQLADLVSTYWVNFIERGDPNGPGLPLWPDDNQQLMRLNRDSAAEPVLSSPKRALLLGEEPEEPVRLPTLAVKAEVPLMKVATYHLQTGRFAPAAVYHGGYIYVIGGSGFRQLLPSIERFDPTTGRSEHFADLRQGRMWHAAAVLGDKIYVVGGVTWQPMGNMANRIDTLLRTHRAIVKGEDLVGHGKHEFPLESTDSVEILDPSLGVLREGPSLATPRDQFGFAVAQGKLVVIGGRSVGRHPRRFINAVEVFDPKSSMWSSGSPAPSPRVGSAATVPGGLVFYAGGYNGQNLCDVDIFDVAQGTWRSLPPTVRPISAHSTVVAAHYALMFGDYREPGEIMAYDLTTCTSETFTLNYEPTRHAAVVVIKDLVYVIGGRRDAEREPLDEIQVFRLSPRAIRKAATYGVHTG